MSESDAAPGNGENAPFRFDAASGELTGPETTARLAPQPSSLLQLLMERRGEVVRRSEIAERLWPAGGADVDQGIAFALREIRKGLEEAGCAPGLVETIPRRGYRLQAPEKPEEDGGSSSEGAPRAGARWKRIAAGGAVLLVGAVVSTLLPSPREPPVIAIIEHRPEAPELAGAARELGALLTTALTGSFDDEAGVVGPTGTASLEGPDDVEGARERLGACIVVSGNVAATEAGSVVVFTQMVRTSDRVHLWASVDTVPSPRAVGDVVEGVVAGAREALSGC